jgi:hypothetical protein
MFKIIGVSRLGNWNFDNWCLFEILDLSAVAPALRSTQCGGGLAKADLVLGISCIGPLFKRVALGDFRCATRRWGDEGGLGKDSRAGMYLAVMRMGAIVLSPDMLWLRLPPDTADAGQICNS